MAENRLQSQGEALPKEHRLLFLTPCECCGENYHSNRVSVVLPPPKTPGLTEMTATGSTNPTDHWIELIRMQQQMLGEHLCAECDAGIKELMNGKE
jgi:hypothetical protein